MINEKTENRYLDYLMTYTNIILEYGEELQKKCKKSRSGEVKINGSKYTYFVTGNGVSLINQKNQLEITFSFITEKDFIYFEKNKFHSFIESDLNATGLGKFFPSNSIVRTNELNECFDKLCDSEKIIKKDKGFIISIDELYKIKKVK